jgi:hypothetical protein
MPFAHNQLKTVLKEAGRVLSASLASRRRMKTPGVGFSFSLRQRYASIINFMSHVGFKKIFNWIVNFSSQRGENSSTFNATDATESITESSASA